MLAHLTLRDYLLVDALDLDFAPGLTVLTGETGAGKSILIGALALALGDRAEAGVVRHGAARAEIAAEFDISGLPELAPWLDENGFACDDAQLILRRTLDATGRSRAFINGSAATLAQLKDAAGFLIDIHGQHAHHALLRAATQRAVLDAYGGASAQADAVSAAWQVWQTAAQQRRDAETHSEARAIEREGLSAALEELNALGDDCAQWDALTQEHARLANGAALIEGAAMLADGLVGDDGAQHALAQLEARLTPLTELDPSLNEVATLIASASAHLDEAAYAVRRYADRLSLDPDTLADLDRRMSDLHRLARKHRVPPAELGSLRERYSIRLSELTASDDLDALAAREAALLADYLAHAQSLSATRTQTADALTRTVTAALAELALGGSVFSVALTPTDTPRAHGLEDIEFRIASHGLPAGPLAKVASGGELSRISLAIQTALSGVAGVPTLIFDEVDVGIGGGVAEAVGRRLARLGATRQVLVITHLPQVAARGAQHLRVVKAIANGHAVSQIDVLDEAARVEEIARMLGGQKITETTRKHAAEMLGA